MQAGGGRKAICLLTTEEGSRQGLSLKGTGYPVDRTDPNSQYCGLSQSIGHGKQVIDY